MDQPDIPGIGPFDPSWETPRATLFSASDGGLRSRNHFGHSGDLSSFVYDEEKRFVSLPPGKRAAAERLGPGIQWIAVVLLLKTR